MKEYVENMKEYEEICRYIGFGTALGLRKIPSTTFLQSLGLGKIPNSPPLNEPWDLEKFHARASSWAPGLGKISIFIPTSYIGFGTRKNSQLSPPSLKNMKHDLYFLAHPRNFSEDTGEAFKWRLNQFSIATHPAHTVSKIRLPHYSGFNNCPVVSNSWNCPVVNEREEFSMKKKYFPIRPLLGDHHQIFQLFSLFTKNFGIFFQGQTFEFFK